MSDTTVLWFTELSGSGKSTIASRLIEKIGKTGKSVMLIDGDSIRSTHHKSLNFAPDDIKENNSLILLCCKENLGKYDFIIVSIISPFRESRENARRILSPHFVEVFVNADLEECVRRDVKGLYRRTLAGEINNFIGMSPNTPYEVPLEPDVTIDTQMENTTSCVEKIFQYIGL